MKLLLFLLISINAKAYNLNVGTGGFLGEKQIGIEKGGFSLIYGFGKVDQISLVYKKQVGYFYGKGFVTKAQNSNFFFQSPSRYKEEFYYPQTQYRLGLGVGFKYKWFYIDTNITDTGLILLYNEDRYAKHFNQLFSTGFGLSVPF